MFSELVESLKTTIGTRAKSSFMGSFIVAWCVFNWKGLYATFVLSTSELPYQESAVRFPDKLSYLSTLYIDPATGGYDNSRLLCLPLAAATITPLAVFFADELVGLARKALSQGAIWVNTCLFKNELVPPEDHRRLHKQLIDLQKANEVAETLAGKATHSRDEYKVKLAEQAMLRENAEGKLLLLEPQAAELRERVAQLETELGETKAKLAEVHIALASKSDSEFEARQELDQRVQRETAARHMVEELQRDIDRGHSARQLLTAERDQLQQRVAVLAAEVSSNGVELVRLRQSEQMNVQAAHNYRTLSRQMLEALTGHYRNVDAIISELRDAEPKGKNITELWPSYSVLQDVVHDARQTLETYKGRIAQDSHDIVSTPDVEALRHTVG